MEEHQCHYIPSFGTRAAGVPKQKTTILWCPKASSPFVHLRLCFELLHVYTTRKVKRETDIVLLIRRSRVVNLIGEHNNKFYLTPTNKLEWICSLWFVLRLNPSIFIYNAHDIFC